MLRTIRMYKSYRLYSQIISKCSKLKLPLTLSPVVEPQNAFKFKYMELYEITVLSSFFRQFNFNPDDGEGSYLYKTNNDLWF